MNTYLAGSNNASGVAFNTGAFQILSNKWKSSGGNLNIFKDGTSVLSTTGFGTGSTITDDGSLAIGGEQDDVDNAYDNTQAFDGDIAEIIFYSSYLNNAQRTIVENYLNIKYAISIATDGFTAGHSSYNVHFTGIGQESDGSFSESVSSGLYIANNGSLENGDYIMWAHNGIANSVVMTDVAGDVEARWARDWYIEQIGAQNVSLKFDMPEGIGGQNPQNISNYVLLFRNATTGNYSEVNATIALGDADQVRFDVLASDLQNGYYTLGTKSETDSPLEGAPGKTWYTLVSGDWNNWETWTLDPSGALPNNPDHLYPQQVSDKVVIKSGKTVTMNLNSITCASLDVDGRLDLGITTGHGFNTISGNGRILMAADNFPTYSDISQFADEGQDNGTVVYYGASDYTLADAQTFYNMEVEVNTGVTVTLLNHLTLNGALTIKSGIFSLNNSAATSNLNITVKGDVLIVNGAKIITGTANARHQFNFYSDLTINGELNFTNRVAYDYNNEATNGIVDANFLSADADQSILCNGISNFYRIEIDKGTDATYILSIEATDASYFKLYGYANEGHADIAQLSANNNALGLVKGTVKIGANISIPVLTNASNYNVSEAAKLWVAGGTVLKNSGNSLVPYGTIELSAGLLEAKVSSGITTRSNGLISVSGGTLNVNQIRTSVFGASNVGGYAQSGGSVNLHDRWYTYSERYCGAGEYIYKF